MRAESIPYRLFARMRNGDLRETPIGVLLYSLALHERSVVIEIQRGRVKKAIMLEDGIAVDCRSNLLHETLAQFLVGKGRLTDVQRAECLAEAGKRGVRIGKVLLDRGIIEAIDLYRALKQNLAYKLLECFTWTGGSFRVLSEFPETDSSDQGIPKKAPGTIWAISSVTPKLTNPRKTSITVQDLSASASVRPPILAKIQKPLSFIQEQTSEPAPTAHAM